MNKEITYPWIEFSFGDKHMFSYGEKYFFSSKKYLYKPQFFNSNLEIVDCEGSLFVIKDLKPVKFSLTLSIKLIGIYYIMEPNYEYLGNISLEEFKDRIWNHVSKRKAFWSPINDGRGLKRMIYEANDFKELILMFR